MTEKRIVTLLCTEFAQPLSQSWTQGEVSSTDRQHGLSLWADMDLNHNFFTELTLNNYSNFSLSLSFIRCKLIIIIKTNKMNRK
jgi:hypothetical protein